MEREYMDENVYEAFLKRMKLIFEEFDNIYVSFSGGKDSGLLLNMTSVYVPKDPHEKAMQRALIQYQNPKNYELVFEALKKCKRMDLVGYGKECLIRPKQGDTKSPKRERIKKKKTIRNIHKKKQ